MTHFWSQMTRVSGREEQVTELAVSKKMAPDGQGKPYSGLLQWERETKLNSTETKGGSDFEWGRELKVLENIRGEVGQCDKVVCICYVRQLPSPKRLEDRGSIILGVSILKGWFPGPWERHSWMVLHCKRLGDLHLKGQTMNLRLQVFWSHCSKERKVKGMSIFRKKPIWVQSSWGTLSPFWPVVRIGAKPMSKALILDVDRFP